MGAFPNSQVLAKLGQCPARCPGSGLSASRPNGCICPSCVLVRLVEILGFAGRGRTLLALAQRQAMAGCSALRTLHHPSPHPSVPHKGQIRGQLLAGTRMRSATIPAERRGSCKASSRARSTSPAAQPRAGVSHKLSPWLLFLQPGSCTSSC